MLRFFSDPGHGWLEVSKRAVDAVDYHPSPYSYYNPKTNMYYLEEDLDASGWLKLTRHQGEFRDIYEPYPSFVRSLPPVNDPKYVAPAQKESWA